MLGQIPRIGLATILVITSGCIVYTSPKCFFDKREELPVLSVYMDSEDGGGLSVSYWEDGIASTFVARGLYCRRLEPEAHQRIMAILERSHPTAEPRASFGDALRQDYGRLRVYAEADGGPAGRTHLWWGTDLEDQPGHVEKLDAIFCALEKPIVRASPNREEAYA